MNKTTVGKNIALGKGSRQYEIYRGTFQFVFIINFTLDVLRFADYEGRQRCIATTTVIVLSCFRLGEVKPPQ